MEELETALDHLVDSSDISWYYYIRYTDGKVWLCDTFWRFKDNIEQTRAQFEKLFGQFMPSVNQGMPELETEDLPELKVEEEQEEEGGG